MAKQVTNSSLSQRLKEASFSEVRTSETLGPELSQPSVQGEAIEGAPIDPVSVNQWLAMTQADQGLLDSLYDFINTTKEGISVVPDSLNGRNKKIFFNYYGTLGKSVKPGEIGQFEVNFYYPPNTQSETL